jgi:hypothetical protein
MPPFGAQILVAATSIVQKRGAVLKRDLDGLGEHSYFFACIVIHGILKPSAAVRLV